MGLESEKDDLLSKTSSTFIVTLIINVVIIMFALLLYGVLTQRTDTPQGFDALDKIGSYISGIFSLISTVWISATFILQMREIRSQREDLQLQRVATESAAVSFKTQVVISIYEKALEALSVSLRDILIALKLVDIDDQRIATRTGLFQIVVDNPNFFLAIEKLIGSDNAVIRILIFQYVTEARNLENLVSQPSFPPEIRTYLYDLTPVAEINSKFEDIYNSLENIPD